MSQPEKGMSSSQASEKKIAGHINEYDYAELIGGNVNVAGITRKKDVFDNLGMSHSVKSGKKWQMFLYSRTRLATNTILKGMGNLSNQLVACIDSLPSNRAMREENPIHYKESLQKPMRELSQELQNTNILEAFFMKVFFEAGEVDFLAILPSNINQVNAHIDQKEFHVFDASECVSIFCDGMVVCNSKKRARNQMDDQKVIFRNSNIQLGEIELRTDPSNWGKMKMWLDSKKVLCFLQERIAETANPRPQIITYGKAIKKIRL